MKKLGELVSPNWYSPLMRGFTNVRYCQTRKIAAEWWYRFLLMNDPDIRIYTVISHEPILSQADEERIRQGKTTLSQIADRQRVRDEDNGDYIDEFGRYVYLQSRLGYSEDIDLRYEEQAEPEFFEIQYVEDDTGTRTQSVACRV